MKFTFGPETHPLPGYTIKRAIDRGAFGEVYYALSDSGKEVALKLLRDNPQIELRGVSQCLNLKHPNLVTLFDVRTDSDGDSWVIMEFLSGDSLEQVLAANPHGLPPGEALQWLAGVADGISCLHERGIVHRDLKPANIFRERNVVKVGDVGLSKFMTPSRRSAQTESVGTVYYMAPEVARGKYGRELDVYSLAIITYEMLTGAVPFHGESTAEILMKHLTSRPDLTRVPMAFRPVLERALEKDPHRRTASVLQLTEEFRQALRLWNRSMQTALEIPSESFVGHTNTATAYRHPVTAAAQPTSHGFSLQKTRTGHESTPANREAACAPGNADCKSGRKWWLFLVIPAVIFMMRVTGRGDFAVSGRSWFVLLLIAGGSYATYLVVSSVVNRLLQPSLDAGMQPSVGIAGSAGTLTLPVYSPVHEKPVVTAASQPRRVYSAELLGPETVRAVPWQLRGQELFASMSWATFWTLVSTAGVALVIQIIGVQTPNPAQDYGELGLFGFTTLVASWAILAISKFCEGTSVSPRRRRLFLALGGAGAGALSWGISRMLLVTPLFVPGQFAGMFPRIGQWDLASFGGEHTPQIPTLAGYIVFFGSLFAIRRWWVHADSFRWQAFRWSSWLLTIGAAWAIPAAFTFPQAWALCWGTALSAVVQLSATRVEPNQRVAFVNAGRQTSAVT